jgi:hypothetical protein
MADPEAQAVVDVPEQTPEPEPEQANSLAALVAPDSEPTIEADAEPKAEPEVPQEPSTPDVDGFLSENLTAVLESEAVQKAMKEATATAANDARQAEEKRLRRETGTNERVGAAIKGVLQNAGVDLQALDKQSLQVMDTHFGAQALFQAEEKANMAASVMVDGLQVPGEAMTTAQGLYDEKNPWPYLTAVRNISNAAAVATAKAEWETTQTAEVARLVQAELDARSKATTNESPPDAPAGVAAALGPSPQEYGAATPAQRAQWNTDGVEVQIPTP